ncbi:hypothetical protein H0H92_011128 [Tricholoma furcatifolium]|nr:hypothetical protein H0H92_011128 [Tricholoma furcatifolium]
MDSRLSSVLAITGITILGGFVAYAVYFDHKRRSDPDFRKKLRKEKKRVDKSIAESQPPKQESEDGEKLTAALREALEQLKKEEPPATPQQKEAFFMEQVALGEQLAARGPALWIPAAMAFYRALKVYPAPMELLHIYQGTISEPIYKVLLFLSQLLWALNFLSQMIMELASLDVSHSSSPVGKSSGDITDDDEEESPTSGGPPSEASSQEWDKARTKAEGYYDKFPPTSMNAHIETREARKVLLLSKDVAAGEIIYKEQPVVTALDADLQESGKYCAHCLRVIEPGTSVQPPEAENPIGSTFCSTTCQAANEVQSHDLLFTTKPPLPAEMIPSYTKDSEEARRAAQEKYVAYLKKDGRAASVLVARFIGRQVTVETAKLTGSPKVKSEFTDVEDSEYLLADHLERLRFLELKPPAEDRDLLAGVLSNTLPGLEHFVTDESHAVNLGKMTYNAFGVCFDGGRDDKPAPTARPEDVEKTRTPHGTSRQIGAAFYTLSSYLTHSCTPSATPSFSNGTAELHLIANRDLKAGDELTVAFVDVTQHEGETTVECRRRRRMELARGWRFACPCSRCAEEAKELSAEEKVADASEEKDGSKVEVSTARFDAELDSSNVE